MPEFPKEMRPKVGLAVIACRNGQILLGRRRNAHGDGTWCCPGGHMEFGESFEETARRESLEEAGIELGQIRLLHVTNDVFTVEGKHYITIFLEAEVLNDPMVCEPDKTECWEWHAWDDLPRPLFLPIENLMKDGIRPTLIA